MTGLDNLLVGNDGMSSLNGGAGTQVPLMDSSYETGSGEGRGREREDERVDSHARAPRRLNQSTNNNSVITLIPTLTVPSD